VPSDAVCGALAQLPSVKLARKPRLADFAVWATGAMIGLGLDAEVFLRAYTANRADAVQDTLEGDVVAGAIFALIEERTEKYGAVMEHYEMRRAFGDLRVYQPRS
jgi:hypothetical protein